MENSNYHVLRDIKLVCRYQADIFARHIVPSDYHLGQDDERTALGVHHKRQQAKSIIVAMFMIIQKAGEIHPFLKEGGWYPINKIEIDYYAIRPILDKETKLTEQEQDQVCYLVVQMDKCASEFT